jgi:hypothetical protein
MRFSIASLVLWAAAAIRQVSAVGATDEYRDADLEQTGYL